MSIKSLLFCLFLYVCLVWVGAAYLQQGPQVREFGLRWTAIGLIAVLGWIVFARMWGWYRIARARSAARPKAVAPKPATFVAHEDDTALLALLEEARAGLAKGAGASGYCGRLADLPAYLLVGPENSGKTSTFINSGLEPAALSGQTGASGQPIPTRLCNIWLAKGAIFIELAGRAFSGDLARWASLLRTLRGTPPSIKSWRRLVSEPEPELNLRAILAFCNVKEFTGTSSPQGREKMDRFSSHWRDRLGAVAEVFGRPFAVYVVATKADSIPYFGDYFARTRGADLNQIFGCSLPLTDRSTQNGEVASADAENKRLTKSFSPLLHQLAERRLPHLAHEPDPLRKPGIYEFPRELRRIRPAFVQFLVDVFRSHPLRHTPFLRGYYFTGICEEEIGPEGAAQRPTGSDISQAPVSDATGMFHGDATQFFRHTDPAKVFRPSGRAGFVRRWAFVSELLNAIVLADHAAPKVIQIDRRLDLYRKLALGAVGGLCFFLCGAFLWSWLGNTHLLGSISGGSRIVVHRQPPTFEEVQSLEMLRLQAAKLLDYQRNGPPLGLRWGLYSGNGLASAARDLYFQRFRRLFLNDLNGAITNRLKSGANDAYEPTYQLLKTHLMISSGVCAPDPAFVSKALRQTLDEVAPSAGPEWRSLAGQQIDFYAKELPFGDPAQIAEDGAAVGSARQRLRSIQGNEQIYTGVLAEAETHFRTSLRLASLAPNYAQVLNGDAEVRGVFSPQGWTYLQKASKDIKSNNAPADSCVVEQKGFVAGIRQNVELEHSIQRSFLHDYIGQWQKFVNSFSVDRYNGAGDAARKLEILADHRSPLLAIFAMASKNTYFPPPGPQSQIIEKPRKVIDGIIKSVGGAGDAPSDNSAETKKLEGTAEINRAFQPVQWIVPPASDTWVTDKNNAYVDALSQLAHSMQEIARASTNSGANMDPAIQQTANQNYDKALEAARQLERGLDPTGSNGLDVSVQRLLEAPIRSVHPFIPTEQFPAERVNASARAFCSSIASTLRKFPFEGAREDARIDELTHLFAPGSGAVWKFQVETLAELTVKDGSHWKSKDGAKLAVAPGMLGFLNRAQAVTDAFFANGATQPQLTYTLRPKLDASFKDAVLELDVDGQAHQWKSSLQKQFIWPAPAGSSDVGARGRILTGSVSFPFASRGGVWGIFRMMEDAEPRLLGSRIVEWKNVRGGDGRLEPIQPAPVRLEIVEFPGGADVFNPRFFEGLQCPGKAVQ